MNTPTPDHEIPEAPPAPEAPPHWDCEQASAWSCGWDAGWQAANPGDRVRAKVAEHARNWRTDSPGGTK